MIWTILWWLLLICSVGLNATLGFYMYKFIKIIMVFEDDISDVIESLDQVDQSLKGVIYLKLFFDDKEVQILVKEVMDSVKMARFNVNLMSKRFTDRSKRKYILVEDVRDKQMESRPTNDNDDNDIAQPVTNKPRQGTVLHVGRTD